MATRFTQLVGCEHPVQQAGIGGIATPRLAAAVSAAGALGTLAQPMTPPEAMRAMTEALAADGKPFAVNFLMPFLDRACVEVAASAARVVEFFYDTPDASLVRTVHAGGALASWQAGSAHEAKAAADAGCDFVTVQGTEAGGHVRGTMPLLPLLDEVLAAVTVPVVAAGGIATARQVAAVLAAGADAARVGTRFVAAEEADAHDGYVDALLHAHGDDTELTEAFSVMWPDAPHRVLSSAVRRAQSLDAETVGEIAIPGGTMPVPRLSVIAPTSQVTGDVAAMALYAGQSVGAVTRREPAAVIVADLVSRLAAPVAT